MIGLRLYIPFASGPETEPGAPCDAVRATLDRPTSRWTKLGLTDNHRSVVTHVGCWVSKFSNLAVLVYTLKAMIVDTEYKSHPNFEGDIIDSLNLWSIHSTCSCRLVLLESGIF